jgi:hypothetical protein
VQSENGTKACPTGTRARAASPRVRFIKVWPWALWDFPSSPGTLLPLLRGCLILNFAHTPATREPRLESSDGF